MGLDGICLSEHGGGWDKWDFDKFAKQYPDLLLIRALEVDTEYGHIGTVGLDGYQSGIHRIHHLRKVIQECEGFMVSVHPFRRFFEKPPLNKSLLFKQPVPLEEAIEHPVFEMTDAIEAVNGACTSRENQFALRRPNSWESRAPAAATRIPRTASAAAPPSSSVASPARTSSSKSCTRGASTPPAA